MILREGIKNDLVRKLQEGLAYLGYHPGPVDGHFGDMTEDAVEAFQKKSKIYIDGKVGPSTADLLNRALGSPRIELHLDLKPSDEEIKNTDKKLKWVRCPADRFENRGGFTKTTLREDVAEAYNRLYKEVHRLGGIITSAGGKRGLGSKASPARSKKSMHYVGRAFDMALPTGMQNPSSDPYIVENAGGRRWTIWCKTDDPSVTEKTIEASYVVTKKNAKGKKYTIIKTREITCRAFNFTALAARHGFRSISARRSFFRGGAYGGAEWWHFQWENHLLPNKTTFGEELLKVYTLQKASKFVYWDEAKNCKWKINWF
jgi:peptidoglycan hydrolase-like protein with peptidoglycan-binding domain